MAKDCAMCEHHIPSVLAIGDNRCALSHHAGLVPTHAAYPTIEWMRGAAAVCGPTASQHAPYSPMIEVRGDVAGEIAKALGSQGRASDRYGI